MDLGEKTFKIVSEGNCYQQSKLMFILVAVVAFIFGSSQLLEGSLKFTFICWYVHNTSKDGF